MVLQRSLILVASVILSACGGLNLISAETEPVPYQDLNYYKVDCPHAAEQMVFLKQQESLLSPYSVDNQRRAIIHYLKNYLTTYCGKELSKPIGCTHVREDMKNGSSQATVCNSNGHLGPLERPVINRWDPLIDSK